MARPFRNGQRQAAVLNDVDIIMLSIAMPRIKKMPIGRLVSSALPERTPQRLIASEDSPSDELPDCLDKRIALGRLPEAAA